MGLTIEHLEKLQTTLEFSNDDYQVELQDGNLVVMGPLDIVSSEIGSELIRLLGNWVKPRKLGRVFDSSGGFILPNTDLRAPDVSFVSAKRLKRPVRDFGNLVPDLVVEIKSKTDRIAILDQKIKMFLNVGAKVGILIDPDRLTVTVYDSNTASRVYSNQDVVTLPELLPDWELIVSDLWSPIFD
jgi:Uma2 family endonuclease